MGEKVMNTVHAGYFAGIAALALAAFATAAAPREENTAAAQAFPGFTHIKSLGGIDEYRLDSNGLSVLLVPDHSAPVVTFQVTYQVGIAQRGDRYHRSHAYSGTHDVQGQRCFQ